MFEEEGAQGLMGVGEWIRKEVDDWDDESISRTRFKAFSGQRSDWEPRYFFWRDLIIKVARHLRIFLISPSQVRNIWFRRGGLTPLCVDDVLFLMYNEGDIVRKGDLVDPTSGRVTQLFKKVTHLMIRSTPAELISDDYLILSKLLKDKADEVVKLLSESHWTSFCVITLRKFREICGGFNEASAVMSYLSGCGKAQYLTVYKREFIEGVKVSLSPAAVSGITGLDCDVLHLISTTEKLQQQLDVIDLRYETNRKLALASRNSGNRNAALRHMKQLKLASESREKYMSLLNRVEEVLCVIGNSESMKKVSEAIQIGSLAIKENRISVEEIQTCLHELDEAVDSQTQIEKALESTLPYTVGEDEDIEEEFKKLELEIDGENFHVPTRQTGEDTAGGEPETSKSAESLSNALLNLKLADAGVKETAVRDSSTSQKTNSSKSHKLEAA